MLAQLRLVLSTVSGGFAPEPFLRFGLMKLSPEEVAEEMLKPSNKARVSDFLESFAVHCARIRASEDDPSTAIT